MKTEQARVNKSWTSSEERQVIALRDKGMSPEQIVQTIGRSVESTKVRLTQIRAAERKRKEAERKRKEAERDGTPGRYLVKMTDFETGRVITYKEVVIAEHRGSTRAWNYAMRLIRKRNKIAEKDNANEFYWMKYL